MHALENGVDKYLTIIYMSKCVKKCIQIEGKGLIKSKNNYKMSL